MSSMKPMAVRVPPLKPHVLPSKPLPWLGGEPLGWSVAPQLRFKTPPRAITLSSLSIGIIGGFNATFPESRGTDGFFTFMSFGYMILCSKPSVAVVQTALVHQHDLSSHRTERERHDRERFGIPS